MADAPERSRDEVAAYLALAQIPGIGAARLRALIAAFGSAGGAIQAPHGALAGLPGFSKAAATAIRGAAVRRGAEVLDQLTKLGAVVLLPEDAAFPALLNEVPEPPALLFAWGDVALLARPAVAIVGSRNHSTYGAEAARLLAAGVAGALITADAALDQGRAVLAVPGPITSLTSLGCNKLIQQGAKPALCAGDILEEIGLSGLTPGRCPGASGERTPPADLTPLQESLWTALAAESRHIDALSGATNAPTSDVLTALTDLELRGVVRQDPGMRFALI